MSRTLFPPLDKRNTRDKAKGLRISSEGHIGELGVRHLSTISRGQDSRQQDPICSPADQYRFAHPPSTSPKHTPLLQSTSPAPSERAIKSVFCTANLPTIMYFFSVISALCEAQLSENSHTTHYNTDDFQVTPTICEATYRPNLIL